jgi:hypothetical protein
LKSFEDLQKLWFVLLKERNMLLTYRHICFKTKTDMHEPLRLRKVSQSMARIKSIIEERSKLHRRATEIQMEQEQRLYAALGTMPPWLSFPPTGKELVAKSSRFRRVRRSEKADLVPSGVTGADADVPSASAHQGGSGYRGGWKIVSQWTRDQKHRLRDWQGPREHRYVYNMTEVRPLYSQLDPEPQPQPSAVLPHNRRTAWMANPPPVKKRSAGRKKPKGGGNPLRPAICKTRTPQRTLMRANA